ncbi:SRPBCC family protein [Flavobacteriaceae bacterium 3-367]|uniref:SRPBCC family protein n=1 Tax=Eudoraea algarum TaxID=3417568 RepID=UPI003281BBD5
MKFTCTIEIDRPQDIVAQLFGDPQYLGEYQEGFLDKTLLEGTAGENGAISKMRYKMGKGEMELTETIMDNSLPDRFLAHYHHKHMDNSMECRFVSLSDSRTRYESEIEYTAFRGFVPRAMAFLFPGMFKKQVQKWLDNFKTFAEKTP